MPSALPTLESGDVETPSGVIEKPEPASTPDPQSQVDRYDRQPRPEPRLSIGREAFYRAPHLCRHSCHCAATLPLTRVIPACDVAPEAVAVTTNPIQPPWKVLPWMDRSPHRVVYLNQIKLITVGSDMSFRGKVLDVVV